MVSAGVVAGQALINRGLAGASTTASAVSTSLSRFISTKGAAITKAVLACSLSVSELVFLAGQIITSTISSGSASRTRLISGAATTASALAGFLSRERLLAASAGHRPSWLGSIQLSAFVDLLGHIVTPQLRQDPLGFSGL